MQKISTCLWFENQAEEAAEFYVSVFGDSRILDVSRFGEGGRGLRTNARASHAKPIPRGNDGCLGSLSLYG
ncbi:UNVERIFIED_ORG: putative 3-demethylubiquinone-9 3-methyltransferase (glyoxalase superfamily) [Arthrobacter sp. UYCu721]